MQNQEKTVRKNTVYKGKILNLRVDDALLPDGRACIRELVEHSGGACALYIEAGKVLFVKQYRYAYGDTLYEIPAGKINAGEPPELSAKRELEEETGIRAGRMELLHEIYPSVGYTNERIYIYLALDAIKGEARPDDGEFVEVEWIELEKAKKMMQDGAIKDAKTLVALQAYLLRQR